MILDPDIRVLTVREPWASLIACGRKPWENRGAREAAFAVCLRGHLIAIHAGLGLDRRALSRPTAPDGKPWPETLHRGHVVAVVRVGEVARPHDLRGSPWRSPEDYGIELLDPIPLDSPVPMVGGQGWLYLRRRKAGDNAQAPPIPRTSRPMPFVAVERQIFQTVTGKVGAS